MQSEARFISIQLLVSVDVVNAVNTATSSSVYGRSQVPGVQVTVSNFRKPKIEDN